MKLGDCVETAANIKSRGDGAGMRGGDAYGRSAELSVSLPPLSAVAAGQVSADVSESVADMSCDSDADVCVDDVNRTFTLMSPVTTSMSRMHGAAYADSMMSAENQQQLVSLVSAADKRQMPSSGPAMLVTNQQQALSVTSSVSAANEQQALASGLITSAVSAISRQQAPLVVMSAVSERQAFTSGLMTSAMSTANQQQAPLALMSASERSAFSSGPAMANQQQTPLATILAASEGPAFSSVPAMSSANQQQALSTLSAASERQVTGGNSSVTSRHLLPVAVSTSSSFVPPGICRHCSSTFFVPTVL